MSKSKSSKEFNELNNLIGDVSFKKEDSIPTPFKSQQMLTGYVRDPEGKLSTENEKIYLKTLSQL